VRRKAINLSRSENRRQKHQQQASEDKPAWFELDPIAGIQSEELEIYLQQLGPVDREIVVARIWGELTFEQIAELVNRPLSVVYRHYRQSLTFLGQQIDGKTNPDNGKRSTH
jgi:RNA polymerase sigma-70 factor (ECF subfamily)